MQQLPETQRQIRIAIIALEKARKELGSTLLKQAGNSRGLEYASLENLHHRVSKAMALLPHGGER